jgi:uncharacterized membrane protein YoaK (UPF0700 family)
MLIRQGEARGPDADRKLAWSLAGIAGALNATGFYAFGLYSSHMTGNTSAIADHLALGDLAGAATYLALIAAFIAGAAVSAMLINAGQRSRLNGIYAFSILLEAILLACIGCAQIWLAEMHRVPFLVFGLSFVMGLQNAVVTRISGARIRTTHVTGMITDIGIELGNLAELAFRRGAGGAQEVALNREKLGLHAVTVLSFLAGGTIGVLTYRAWGSVLIFGAAVALAAMALAGLTASRAIAQDAAG